MEDANKIDASDSASDSLSMRSYYSSQSILSRQRLDQVIIKPSTVVPKNKQVVFWTSVITDGAFRQPVQKNKVKYNNNQLMHN